MGARLGQHFLVDPQASDRIVDAAAISASSYVVEIGPGKGVLTRRLLGTGAQVTAVELDARLVESLGREFAGQDRLHLIRSDFLKLELSELQSPCIVVSNLPYAVASPILQRILPWDGWTRAVLMFQKEVGERILAGPGSRKYGVLSISVALHASVEHILDVSKTSFAPRPQVDSVVLGFNPLPEPRVPGGEAEERVMSVVRAAFQHRRKMIANSIALGLKLTPLAVDAALTRAGISKTARAEEISLDGFCAVAEHLSN